MVRMRSLSSLVYLIHEICSSYGGGISRRSSTVALIRVVVSLDPVFAELTAFVLQQISAAGLLISEPLSGLHMEKSQWLMISREKIDHLSTTGMKEHGPSLWL